MDTEKNIFFGKDIGTTHIWFWQAHLKGFLFPKRLFYQIADFYLLYIEDSLWFHGLPALWKNYLPVLCRDRW